jgi:hypothetical protein
METPSYANEPKQASKQPGAPGDVAEGSFAEAGKQDEAKSATEGTKDACSKALQHSRRTQNKKICTDA